MSSENISVKRQTRKDGKEYIYQQRWYSGRPTLTLRGRHIWRFSMVTKIEEINELTQST